MTECGVCLFAGEDFGGNGFFNEERTVKGQRQCCECGCIIPAGTPHEFAGYESDGRWIYQRTCLVCAEIAWEFFCDARLYGCLWDYMADVYDKLGSSCFERLKTPAAKAELQRRWMRWKGLAA